jgi:Fungal potassium channel
LWVFALISIAVYAVDTFTAINLLVFSRWASQIKPAIPFSVSRWIFAICIIISFVLLAFRWLHTVRVLKSDGVAESYLDPLAARVQSIRVGHQCWKRFLVYAELTKSKKGADYVALFSYFSFEGENAQANAI